MYSLDDAVVDRLLAETVPSFQLSCRGTKNLGFGWLYYGLTRTLRPHRVVVVGSKAGFAPVLFALAARDNQGSGISSIDCESVEIGPVVHRPAVHFIDPSYSCERGDKNHWYGLGRWDDPETVESLWRCYGVEGVIRHFKVTSAEYRKSCYDGVPIDLLYVDGDHSYQGIMSDLTEFYPLLSDGAIVLAHDVDPGCKEAEGYRVLGDLDPSLYEAMRIPVYPGLAILRRK